MSLSLPARARLAARMALSSLLGLLPQSWVHRVRTRYVGATGMERRALHGVAAVLRYRTLEPLTEFTLPGDHEHRLAAADSRMVRKLYWYGEEGHEPGEAYWWRRLCANATSIVELGSNIGFFSVEGAAAAPKADYVAVEANPETAEVLRRNLALNSHDHVRVIAAAVVGDHETTEVELALPDQDRYGAPPGAYLKVGGEGVGNRPSSRAVTVPAVPADQLLADADLIKLDIEGYEANVLSATYETLVANRPIIVVEVLENVPRLRGILTDLSADGYLVFGIGADSLHLITADQLATPGDLPRFGTRDVILVPAERAASL